MFDITQIRSGLNKKNLKEDIQYIDEVLNDVVYIDSSDNTNIDVEVLDYMKIVELLKKNSHLHKNFTVLQKITNTMVDSWNSTSPTKLSQLINDSNFVTEGYVNSKISEIIGEYKNDIYLTSNSGSNFILNCDSEGVLVTYSTYIDKPIEVWKKIILRSPNGTKYLLNIDNDGVLNPLKMF